MTPLVGADGEVYAVSQGQVAVSGFTAEGKAGTVTKGVPTSGRIPKGAIIESELRFAMHEMKAVRISLRNPDFTTSRRISIAINKFLGTPMALPTDPATG